MHQPTDGLLPDVLAEFALSNSLPRQNVCLVTGDHERTLKGLRLGIGPFPVYTFDLRDAGGPDLLRRKQPVQPQSGSTT